MQGVSAASPNRGSPFPKCPRTEFVKMRFEIFVPESHYPGDVAVVHLTTVFPEALEQLIISYVGNALHDRTMMEMKWFHVYHKMTECLHHMMFDHTHTMLLDQI